MRRGGDGDGGGQVVKVHMSSNESFGKKYQVGDVVGVMLDLHDKTISK